MAHLSTLWAFHPNGDSMLTCCDLGDDRSCSARKLVITVWPYHGYPEVQLGNWNSPLTLWMVVSGYPNLVSPFAMVQEVDSWITTYQLEISLFFAGKCRKLAKHAIENLPKNQEVNPANTGNVVKARVVNQHGFSSSPHRSWHQGWGKRPFATLGFDMF